MTEADWKKAENALSTVYGHVNLTIDGYNVSVGYVKETATKYCLAVYIDGTFKMKWCLEECDIRRRFCRKVTKKMYTEKAKADFVKAVGKRAAAIFEKEHASILKYEYYEPYFGSFRTLKSHLVRNNKSIELAE